MQVTAESLLRIEKVRPPLSAVGKKHSRKPALRVKRVPLFGGMRVEPRRMYILLRPERFYLSGRSFIILEEIL